MLFLLQVSEHGFGHCSFLTLAVWPLLMLPFYGLKLNKAVKKKYAGTVDTLEVSVPREMVSVFDFNPT